MLKKIFIGLFAVIIAGSAGYLVYADINGLFLRSDDQAKALVDEYVTSVVKNYTSDTKQSFRGIVKQGCDFWYLNDYKTNNIAKNHSEGTGFEVDKADYSIDYNSVTYNNKQYTIDATVTKIIRYRNTPETDTSVSRHIFTIEQDTKHEILLKIQAPSGFTSLREPFFKKIVQKPFALSPCTI